MSSWLYVVGVASGLYFTERGEETEYFQDFLSCANSKQWDGLWTFSKYVNCLVRFLFVASSSSSFTSFLPCSASFSSLRPFTFLYPCIRIPPFPHIPHDLPSCFIVDPFPNSSRSATSQHLPLPDLSHLHSLSDAVSAGRKTKAILFGATMASRPVTFSLEEWISKMERCVYAWKSFPMERLTTKATNSTNLRTVVISFHKMVYLHSRLYVASNTWMKLIVIVLAMTGATLLTLNFIIKRKQKIWSRYAMFYCQY